MTRHVPILTETIVRLLVSENVALPGCVGWIVDATLGGGGHTSAILQALEGSSALSGVRILAIDQDEQVIERAKYHFKHALAAGRLELKHIRFGDLERLMLERPVYGILADLGFSSDQIEDGQRGLSFLKDGPLDMRMDTSREETAVDFLKRVPERELADILFEYGEERYSRKIARAIMYARDSGRLPTTTVAFAELIQSAVPASYRNKRIHAATRSFQALRIAVNHELEELDALLERVMIHLKPGGRALVMSFHSLEDRRVKKKFRDFAQQDIFRVLTPKPLEVSAEELRVNPRSRSAKLRGCEKL